MMWLIILDYATLTSSEMSAHTDLDSTPDSEFDSDSVDNFCTNVSHKSVFVIE